MLTVGEYIRQRRAYLDIRLEDLARRLTDRGFKTAKTTVGNWENDVHAPPMENPQFVLALIDALEDEPLHFFAEIGYLGDNQITEYLRRTSVSDRNFLREFFHLLGSEPHDKQAKD